VLRHTDFSVGQKYLLRPLEAARRKGFKGFGILLPEAFFDSLGFLSAAYIQP